MKTNHGKKHIRWFYVDFVVTIFRQPNLHEAFHISYPKTHHCIEVEISAEFYPWRPEAEAAEPSETAPFRRAGSRCKWIIITTTILKSRLFMSLNRWNVHQLATTIVNRSLPVGEMFTNSQQLLAMVSVARKNPWRTCDFPSTKWLISCSVMVRWTLFRLQLTLIMTHADTVDQPQCSRTWSWRSKEVLLPNKQLGLKLITCDNCHSGRTVLCEMAVDHNSHPYSHWTSM